MNMAELVVALDFDDALEALNMATSLRGQAPWVKVGLELFTVEGPRVLYALKGLGYKVFLDARAILPSGPKCTAIFTARLCSLCLNA